MGLEGAALTALGSYAQRHSSVCRIRLRPVDHAPLLKWMSPVFTQWSSMLEELEGAFAHAWEAEDVLVQSDQKLYLFYQFALEGVADYAELLYEQREQLQALQ